MLPHHSATSVAGVRCGGADWAVWWLPPAPRVEVAGLLTLWVAVPCVCRLATRHRQGE